MRIEDEKLQNFPVGRSIQHSREHFRFDYASAVNVTRLITSRHETSVDNDRVDPPSQITNPVEEEPEIVPHFPPLFVLELALLDVSARAIVCSRRQPVRVWVAYERRKWHREDAVSGWFADCYYAAASTLDRATLSRSRVSASARANRHSPTFGPRTFSTSLLNASRRAILVALQVTAPQRVVISYGQIMGDPLGDLCWQQKSPATIYRAQLLNSLIL